MRFGNRSNPPRGCRFKSCHPDRKAKGRPSGRPCFLGMSVVLNLLQAGPHRRRLRPRAAASGGAVGTNPVIPTNPGSEKPGKARKRPRGPRNSGGILRERAYDAEGLVGGRERPRTDRADGIRGCRHCRSAAKGPSTCGPIPSLRQCESRIEAIAPRCRQDDPEQGNGKTISARPAPSSGPLPTFDGQLPTGADPQARGGSRTPSERQRDEQAERAPAS